MFTSFPSSSTLLTDIFSILRTGSLNGVRRTYMCTARHCQNTLRSDQDHMCVSVHGRRWSSRSHRNKKPENSLFCVFSSFIAFLSTLQRFNFMFRSFHLKKNWNNFRNHIFLSAEATSEENRRWHSPFGHMQSQCQAFFGKSFCHNLCVRRETHWGWCECVCQPGKSVMKFIDVIFAFRSRSSCILSHYVCSHGFV